MADIYLNPLDVAPVRGSRSSRDSNFPAPPQKHTPEDIRAFGDTLAHQIARRDPTPVLTNKALSIPTQDSMKGVSPSEPQPNQAEASPASNQEEIAREALIVEAPPAPSPLPKSDSHLAEEREMISQNAPELVSPAASNLRQSMQRELEALNNEKQQTGIKADNQADDQAPVKGSETPSRQMADARESSDYTPSPSVMDANISKPDHGAAIDDDVSAATTYIVRRGDTLSEIVAEAMRARGVSYNTRDLYRMVNQVADWNGIRNPNLIYPGQELDLSAVGNPVLARGGPVSELSFSSTPTPSPVSADEYLAPLRGQITSGFGTRVHPIRGVEHHHNGIDIAAPEGTPIQPVKPGVVVFSGEKGGYGKIVEVDHDDGTHSLYAHLSKRLVRVGDRVEHSMPLGLVGQTGSSTGPHLHLEIHNQGRPIDPLTVLPENFIALR